MAASKKRVADTYLTHDNWDNDDSEDSQEEPGVFQEANEEELSKRTIRKAKRRGTGEKNEEKTTKNPFAAFGGFGAINGPKLTFGTKPVIAPTKTNESLLESKANKENNFNNNFWGSSTKTEEEKKDFFSNRPNTDIKPASFNVTTKEKSPVDDQLKIVNKKEESQEKNKMNGDFHKELCDLNICLLNWIKGHIDENPCIDLQPVFRDYTSHMKELETKYSINKNTAETTPSTIIVSKEEKNVYKTPDNANKSTAIISSTTQTSSSSSTFSSSTPIPANPFGDLKTSSASLFNSQSPFALKSCTTTAMTKCTVPETVTEEGDGEEVPQPERKTVVESDAFHQIRCKLFFKKGSEWKELGIGVLYLKPGADEDKIQLLIRMETTTGKVLLNVSITKDTPTSRSGKNNIMVVTIPNPPVFSKPTEGDNSTPCTYLIRVKGTTEADELFEKLKKN